MEIWRTCKETGKEFSSCRGFLNHLRTLKMSSKNYYDKHYRKDDEGFCTECGEPTKYHGFAYSQYCSSACHNKSDGFRELISKRFITNPDALLSFIEKRKGVDCNIEKRRATIKSKCEKLGITEFEYYSEHSKRGHRSITPEVRAAATRKALETKLKNGTVCYRSGYKSYPFFDETISLQGYEPIVLDCLIHDLKLGKEQIIAGKKEIPVIDYMKADGTFHQYFPDFFLPEHNILVEVKSSYTYDQHKDDVLRKCQASVDSGYSIVLLVLSQHESRKRKLDGSKNLLDWAISSQAPKPTWYGEGSTTIPLWE